MKFEILLQSIALWAVALFSLRVAVAGNPLYTLILRSEPSFLKGVDELLTGERQPEPGAPETSFLRRFSRLVLLELVVVGLEVGMLVFLLLQHRMLPLVWTLLGKDIAMVAVSGWGAALRRNGGLFASLQNLPRWMVVTDRVSSLVSGVGFLILLLAVNHLIP